MSVFENGLTNTIARKKLNEYKNDLVKFEKGLSRKIRFSDVSIVNPREPRFFPMNMIRAMQKLKNVNDSDLNRNWKRLSVGCKPSVDLFALGTGIAGIKDSPAIREAVYVCGITDIPTLKNISNGGMVVLDTVTCLNPIQIKMQSIYDELHKKHQERENAVYRVLEGPKLCMETLKLKFEKKSKSSNGVDIENENFTLEDIPEDLKNTQFFKDLEIAGNISLKKEKRKPKQKINK